MQNEENFSSNLLGISFIGFREDLVIPFINKLISEGAGSFIFLESAEKPIEAVKISNDLRNRIIDIMQERKIRYEFIQVINIWSIEEYLKILSVQKTKLAINISAGPSTFASAATLFSIFKDAKIYHDVKQYKGNSFFVFFELDPLKNLFKADLDIIDNIILEAICKGFNTISTITEYIRTNHGNLSERAIAYRVKNLVIKKILIEEDYKPIHYKVDKIVKYIMPYI
ncbi:MAG: hypothetical protein QXZ12_07900 [Thermoplasmata archaeon]